MSNSSKKKYRRRDREESAELKRQTNKINGYENFRKVRDNQIAMQTQTFITNLFSTLRFIYFYEPLFRYFTINFHLTNSNTDFLFYIQF